MKTPEEILGTLFYKPEERDWYKTVILAMQGYANQLVDEIKPAVKPPLGLMPMFIHRDLRIDDIKEAIIRYALAEKPIPKEWIAELQTLESQSKTTNT